MDYFWTQIIELKTDHSDATRLLHQLHQQLGIHLIDKIHESIVNHHNGLHKNTKLRTYALIRQNFQPLHYFSQVKDPDLVRVLAQFRIGSHNLNIEEYRRKRTTTPFCLSCEDTIEDETHVLLYCPLYQVHRSKLFNLLNISMTLLNDAQPKHLLSLLLSSSDEFVNLQVALYLKKLLKTRRSFGTT